jgi:hypothetical protein
LSKEQLREFLDNLKKVIDDAVAALPDHAQFLEQYCYGRT